MTFININLIFMYKCASRYIFQSYVVRTNDDVVKTVAIAVSGGSDRGADFQRGT
jgi:hypothetical protein